MIPGCSRLLRVTSSVLTLIFTITIFSLINSPNISADEITYPFKKCTAKPSNPAPGQEVNFTIETSVKYKLEGIIFVKNGQDKTINFKDSKESTTRTISLGNFTKPGTYNVEAWNTKIGPQSKCELNAAFVISTNKLKLEAPQSPITTKITTLPSLIITGLTEGKIYNVKLSNWKGGDLADHTRPNPNDWEAFGGKIIAHDICNNGQASRADCSDPFGDGTYGLSVYEKGGGFIDSLSFEVAAGKGGGGQNPCVGGICNTAIGNISTDPTEFAGRILKIATGLAGGLALILMVIGSIRVLTSSGDQQKLSGGRDMIVAAVAGLLFLIFSVLILKFIGVEIVNIPFV